MAICSEVRSLLFDISHPPAMSSRKVSMSGSLTTYQTEMRPFRHSSLEILDTGQMAGTNHAPQIFHKLSLDTKGLGCVAEIRKLSHDTLEFLLDARIGAQLSR
jgi:hypothetical protein